MPNFYCAVRATRGVVALCLFLAGGLNALARTIVSDAAQRTLSQKIDAAANAISQKHVAPGMAIVVVKDGKVAYEKGFGATRITNGTAVGSISKPITALALAMLVQVGKLNWDDALSRHIPELQAANPAVARLTIRQVLSHQTRLNLDHLEPLL